VLIAVGIGARLLESADGGRSWTEGARAVPPPTEPRLHGARDGIRPPAPAGWDMSHVHIGADGIGLAAGCESVRGDEWRSSTARFWRTGDGGVTWQAIEPDIGFWGRLRAWPSWPPEEVDSVAVLAGGVVAFAWEDPWLYEGPHCHIVLSADVGARWRYVRLPDGCNALACGPGPLRVFGSGRIEVRSGSGAFRREAVQLDWNLPPGYSEGNLPPRSVQFTSESEGLGLVVSWPREKPPRPPEELPPPLVGLARTEDGGRLWRVVSTWEGPRFTDLNRRHQLTLDLR
jgi:hypothetical protein